MNTNKVSEVKLTYTSNIDLTKARQMSSSLDAYEVAIANWDQEEIETRESFKIICLNRGNKFKAIYEISKGGVSGTVVDAKLVFIAALKTLSSGIVLVHNHPSGNPNPSMADIKITQKLKRAGEFLDIAVLDHIIITPLGKYYSFADEGRM